MDTITYAVYESNGRWHADRHFRPEGAEPAVVGLGRFRSRGAALRACAGDHRTVRLCAAAAGVTARVVRATV